MASPQRVRICLLIPHLGGGGAEHVIETLAQRLNPEKYDIHLVLTGSGTGAAPSPSRTTIHRLGARRVRHSTLKLLSLFWRLRPALILSGIAHLNLLVLFLRPFLPGSTRIIVRQNGSLAATFAAHSHPRLVRHAYSHAYRKADTIICQSDAMAREIAEILGVDELKLIVLPNPTDVQRLRHKVTSSQPANGDNALLLAIGRLAPEKGFDILLEAFAQIAPGYPSAELVIAGEGSSKAALIQQSKALGLGERLHLPGHVSDPITLFGHASLLVISSRTEGIPNVLLEAAAVGIPIVATPASSGLVDLLQNRDGTWLAADVSSSALRKALEIALKAIPFRRRFHHTWIDAFDLSQAVPAYERVIDRVILGDTL